MRQTREHVLSQGDLSSMITSRDENGDLIMRVAMIPEEDGVRLILYRRYPAGLVCYVVAYCYQCGTSFSDTFSAIENRPEHNEASAAAVLVRLTRHVQTSHKEALQ